MALLTGIIGTGFKKVWVWGYQLKDAEARAERWESIALRALKVSEKIADKTPEVTNDA